MHDPEPAVSDDTLSMPHWAESSRESLSGSAARDAIRARLFPAVAQPERTEPRRVGRFTILHTLGRGGMGVVYAAYDPRLDRKVALKLMRSKLADRGEQLLTHEAQGLAKLSHPNVVSVHEVGEHDGATFIAMEFVDGVTLRQWLATPRDWRTVVAVLIAAGRGLAAAHAAGLVHRDFKPDNVLVGEDGRPRVLDFGLARDVDLIDESEQLPTTVGDDSSQGSLTLQPRQLAGTPAYMAPELFVGRTAGPAADQWAFCVVAFEALFGLRPFAGASLSELAAAVAEAPPLEPERRGEVPTAVREVIVRGLAKQSEQRWRSMTVLLDALEGACERRSRRARAAAALLLGGGLALLGAALAREPELELCPRDPSALAGTWDEQREAALTQRYHDTGLPYADGAAKIVSERLDQWARDWTEGRHAACSASRIDGTQSDTMLDTRMACLDRQRAEVEGLLALMLEHPAKTVVAQTATLLDAVPEPSSCAGPLDAAALPDDPEAAAAIQTGYERLERANGLRLLREVEQAHAELEQLAEEPAVRSHAPLELTVRMHRAELEFEIGQPSASLELFHAAVLDARQLGLHELETDILVRMAVTIGDAGEIDLAAWILADAQRAVMMSGRRGDLRAARLAWAQGRLAQRESKFERAANKFERALELSREAGEIIATERVSLDIAKLEAERGQPELAKRRYEQLLAEQSARWGPDSPSVARTEHELALLALEHGQLDEAKRRFERAAKIYAAEGPLAPGLASIADGRAKLAFAEGELGDARALVEAGLRIADANGELAADSKENLLLALGVICFFEGDFEASVAAYEHALRLIRASDGEGDPRIGLTHSNIGESLLALGQLDRAHAEFVTALDQLEAILAFDDPRLAQPLSGLGLSELELGDPTVARRRLERALTLIDGLAEPAELAKIQLALARALAGSGNELDRARELASAAATGYERLGLVEQAAAAAAWSP